VIEIDLTLEDGSRRQLQKQSPIVVGRDPGADVRLRGWRVARHHARIYRTDAAIMMDDLGSLFGTLVNGRRIGQSCPLQPEDEILIGGYMLQVRSMPPGRVPTESRIAFKNNDGSFKDTSRKPGSAAVTPDDEEQSPASLVDGLRPSSTAARADTDASPQVNHHDALLPVTLTRNVTSEDAGGRAPDTAMHVEARPSGACSRPRPVRCPEYEPGSTRSTGDVAWAEWGRRLHRMLMESLDLRRRDVASMSDIALRLEADKLLKGIIEREDREIPAHLDRNLLRQQVLDEAVGLGPLENLLADPEITEIMVNRYDELYVEIRGRLHRHPTAFSSERALLGVIERIVTPLGRRIDESSPMVDARLKDGSRVNAVIAPIALKGATLTIRKFPARHLTIHDLLAGSSLSPAMARFLELCVIDRKNIVISGGTGSGKTTLLNILSNFVPDHERIITIEDAAELRLHHSHLVALEARPANLEGRGAVTIRDLVRNALRMRPDRIVVGECRGPEALDMLQAMNTGHEGSLTTLHANSPRDALARLETMVLMAGMELPLVAIREQIAASIDIIVQQTRRATGHRIITSIAEITGMESGRIQLQELFRYEEQGETAAFVGAGIVPGFFENWCARGLAQPGDFFFESTPLAGRTWRQTCRSGSHLPA